jgi:hypothetical protein
MPVDRSVAGDVQGTSMSLRRARALRLPILGVIGLTGVLGILRRRSRGRPTGAQLMSMNDADFAAFVKSTGLKTVTTAGLRADGPTD